MSAQQLSILEPTPTPADLSTRKSRWLDRVRDAVRRRHRGQAITADDVHETMREHPDLRIPDGMSPNVMGGFFADWACAERTDRFVRSERPGAHGNLLRVWVVR